MSPSGSGACLSRRTPPHLKATEPKAPAMFSQNLLQFYGIDWLASTMTVAMIYSLGNGRRIGFGFGVIANLSWIVFASLAASLPILLSNIIFLALNIRGWRAWQSPHTQEFVA
jgi:nicotinamide riboside transporter PnuC